MTTTEKLKAAIANAMKHDPAGENPNEMMGRVASMILDKGGTWDLSENDQRALAFVYAKAESAAALASPPAAREEKLYGIAQSMAAIPVRDCPWGCDRREHNATCPVTEAQEAIRGTP